jgi:hypothetical protein
MDPKLRSVWLGVAIVALRAHASDTIAGWSELAAITDVVTVMTTDADGDPRETPVWIAVLDDRGYVCTNDSRWFENLSRESSFALEIGETRLAMRAEAIHDPALRARVDEAFRAKYPWGRWLMELFGGTGGKHCLGLSPR